METGKACFTRLVETIVCVCMCDPHLGLLSPKSSATAPLYVYQHLRSGRSQTCKCWMWHILGEHGSYPGLSSCFFFFNIVFAGKVAPVQRGVSAKGRVCCTLTFVNGMPIVVCVCVCVRERESERERERERERESEYKCVCVCVCVCVCITL